MFFRWMLKKRRHSLILFGSSALSMPFVGMTIFLCLQIGAYKIAVLIGLFFCGFMWITTYTLKDILKSKTEYNKEI